MYEYEFIWVPLVGGQGGWFYDCQEVVKNMGNQGWRLIDKMPCYNDLELAPYGYHLVFERKVQE